MTLSKKFPPPPYINFCEPLPGDLTLQEAHLRSKEQKWRLNTQEDGDQLESDAQESPDLQDAQEKHKSPPCPKKKSKEKVTVVH